MIPNLIAIFLCGSIAKGTIQPGKSDVMDACVVLSDQTSHDYRSFCNSLSAMTSICIWLESCGLPYHPFLYCFETEFCTHQFGLFIKAWCSNKSSRVLFGPDLRRSAQSSPGMQEALVDSFPVIRAALQQMTCIFYPHASHREISLCSHLIRGFLKAAPTLACLKLGHHVDESESRAALSRLRNHIVSSRFDLIETLISGLITLEDARLVVRECLSLYEQIYLEVQDNSPDQFDATEEIGQF